MRRKIHRSLRRSSPVHRRVFRPVLSWLEARTLLSGNPTYYTVNLTSDTGASSGADVNTGNPSGDLLWAVEQANANTNTSGSVINFDPVLFATPQTITLSSALELSEPDGPEIIDGPAAGVVISGGWHCCTPNGFRDVQVDNGTSAGISDLTITNSSIAGIENAGSLAVTGTTIAQSNSGIVNDPGAALTVTNSTIANNGTYNGDGRAGIDNYGALAAINTTIAYDASGGLADEPGASATLDNTIVARNLSPVDGHHYDDISGTVSPASSYNLIGPGGSGGLSDSDGRHNQVDVLDPGLASGELITGWDHSWGKHGGPTETIALLPGSPAIDAGSVALAVDPTTGQPLAHDQRGAGYPRTVTVNGAPTVDIGAFESPMIGSPTVYTVTNTSNDASVAGSLPWAINQANHQGNPGYSPANPAGSQVTFAIPTSDLGYDASTHSWTITPSSTLELSEEDGPEVIQGPGASALTVSGNNLDEVFLVDGDTTAAISGLTIPAEGLSPSVIGFGIQNNGELTVHGCVVSGDHVAPTVAVGLGFGGAILNNAILTVTDSKVKDNTVLGLCYGILSGGVLSVADSTIAENQSTNTGGGAVVTGVATITNSSITGNSAVYLGGGIECVGGSLTITRSTIADNSDTGTRASTGAGGGLVLYGGSAHVTDSTIANNMAPTGGGIYVAGGQLTITDSTIAGNTATAGSGGGLWDSGSHPFGNPPEPAILDNCIIADNMGPSGPADMVGSNVSPASANNLIGAEKTGSLTNGTNGNIVGTPASPINPMFGPLQNNGGPTETMALLPGSPAIGAGSVSLAVDANGNPLTTDQRGAGYQRTVTVNGNPTVDIGAFQTQQVPTSTSVTSTFDPSVSGQSVTFTVTVSPLAPHGGTPAGTVTFLDGTTVLDTETLSGATASFTTAALPVGSHAITAVYSGDPDHFTSTSAALTQQVNDLNAANLASVVTAAQTSGGTVTLTAATTSTLTNTLSTISNLPSSTSGTVVVDLSNNTTYQQQDSGGNTITIVASAPSGTTLTIRCSTGNATVYDLQAAGGNVYIHGSANGTITVVGTSPALKITGGSVTIGSGVTLVTATAAPTILVSGGSLKIRNATIQESTGSAQAAIVITGGSVDLGTPSSPGGNILNVNGAGTLIQNTSGSPVPAVGDTFENNGAPITSNFGVVSLSAPSAQTANQGVPKSFTLGSLTDTVNDSQSWTVDVNWGDGSAHTGFNATATGALSAQSHAFALPGSYTVTITAADPVASGVTAWSLVRTFSVTVAPSLFVVNATASGALTLSGNASVKIPGAIVVDSTSTTAISAIGNTLLTASVIDVAGGVQRAGTATISPAPATNLSVNDPFASLAGPCPSGTLSSVSLTKGSQTINPGIYSQITVSGSASLTLNPGVYIIEGGGLTVTGSASISGSGVMIYNAGSNYPNPGGNFGGITLSGNGTFNLSAPSSGTYAGILIFQSRQNTRALSLSGGAMAGMTGTIYAANALLSMSGNASLQNPLVVGTLNLSGNVSLTQMAVGSGGIGDISGIANTLLAGNLSVFINDPSGLFTSDELARIQDAINAWDAILAPYNVTITEVSDPSEANIVIDTDTTSACGGMADGVLGCYNEPNSEITLIQGWNWYAGADPTQIGAGQYDFETTVLHEIGHALGLGGSTNPTSPMNETLAAGVADRTVTPQDLNIPDPPEGADPQMAAGFHFSSAASAATLNGFAVTVALASSFCPAGLMALPGAGASPSSPFSVFGVPDSVAGSQLSPQNDTTSPLVVQQVDRECESGLIWRVASQSMARDLLPPLDSPHQAAEAFAREQRAEDTPSGRAHPVIPEFDGPGRQDEPAAAPVGVRPQPVIDSALDDLASEIGLKHRRGVLGPSAGPVPPVDDDAVMEARRNVRPSDSDRSRFNPPPGARTPAAEPAGEPTPFAARLAAILFAAGLYGHGAVAAKHRDQRVGKPDRTTQARNLRRYPKFR
jgi:hypothetical protein